jgi:hypothetical protein
MSLRAMGPTLVCILIAFGMTAPVWVAAGPSLVGYWPATDLAGSVWAHWWAASAIGHGTNPFMGTASFFPIGVAPVMQYNLLDAILDAPLIWLAGPRIGYNLSCVLALTTTGMGAHILAKTAGCGRAGALFAAVAIESSSAIALELFAGRISQVMIVFLLLALAGVMRLIQTKSSARFAAMVGLAAAATALVYWYFGFALILASMILLLINRSTLQPKHWKALGIAGVVGLSLTLPLALDLLNQWDSLPGVNRGGGNTESGREIAIKNGRWWLWPLIAPGKLHGHQIGLITLALVGWAIRTRTTQIKSWLYVAAAGWVLAMGPVLNGWSGPTNIPLPFGWMMDYVPTFDRMWWPRRFEILTTIGLTIVAAKGLDDWLKDRKRPHLWLFAALLLSLIDAPLRSGIMPIQASKPPPISSALYAPVDGPILSTPIHPAGNLSNRLLWAQTIHGQSTLNGDGEHIKGHQSEKFQTWMRQSRVLQALFTLDRTGHVEDEITPADVLYLIESGLKYAVVDPAIFQNPTRSETHIRFFRALWGAPIHTHEHGAVWKISAIDTSVQLQLKTANRSSRRSR